MHTSFLKFINVALASYVISGCKGHPRTKGAAMLYVKFTCEICSIFIGAYANKEEFFKDLPYYRELARDWGKTTGGNKVKISLVKVNDPDEELDAILGGTTPPWHLTDMELREVLKYGWYWMRPACIREQKRRG